MIAHTLPMKGAAEYVVARIMQDLNGWGCASVALKSGQEPISAALKPEVQMVSDVEVACEDSPVGKSQSNWEAARGIREATGQMRTMKEAVASRYGDNDLARTPGAVLAGKTHRIDTHEVRGRNLWKDGACET